MYLIDMVSTGDVEYLDRCMTELTRTVSQFLATCTSSMWHTGVNFAFDSVDGVILS